MRIAGRLLTSMALGAEQSGKIVITALAASLCRGVRSVIPRRKLRSLRLMMGARNPPMEIVLAKVPGTRSTVMTTKFMSLLAAAAAIGGAATIFPETAAAQGTLMVEGKNYPLTHTRAYPTTIYSEEGIAVV